MTTISVVTNSPSPAIKARIRPCSGLPVARRYSTRAHVSARITAAPWLWRPSGRCQGPGVCLAGSLDVEDLSAELRAADRRT